MLRLYTLRLDGGCWYVGVTRNPERRMRAHQNGTGAAWTRAHAPIEPTFASIRELDCEEPRAKLLEDAETKALMLLHGVDCVRGGSYTQVVLDETARTALLIELRHAVGACLRCGGSCHDTRYCAAPRPEKRRRLVAQPRASLSSMSILELPIEILEEILSHGGSAAFHSFLNTCTQARAAVRAGVLLKLTQGLNADQKRAIEVVASGRNVYVGGGAGVGKTHVLHRVVDFLKKTGRSVACVAPTGIAARCIHTKAQASYTIHYYFRLASKRRDIGSDPFVFGAPSCPSESSRRSRMAEEDDEANDDDLSVDAAPTFVLNDAQIDKYNRLHAILLDEVSMVSAEILDALDKTLQEARGTTKPFGGIQVVAFGDFCQLEPVIANRAAYSQRYDRGVYAFQAAAWSHLQPVVLHEVVRQANAEFARILNKMRFGTLTERDREWLLLHSRQGDADARLTIYHTNAEANALNKTRLLALPGELQGFEREEWHGKIVAGVFTRISDDDARMLRLKAPTAALRRIVHLKIGCAVRATANCYTYNADDDAFDLCLANGEQGVVTMIDGRSVWVRWQPLGEIPERLQIVPYKSKRYRQRRLRSNVVEQYVSCARQLPLEVCYASTTHKVQGLTLTNSVDLFAPRYRVPALMYVQLSRAASIDLVRFGDALCGKQPLVDRRVKTYYAKLMSDNNAV